jgi:hypothetical protein
LSPILVRPVREQLEHDRVIRLLQAKYKRKFEVAINPGNEQAMPVGTAPSAWYPDLVLQSTERSHKLLGVVEVETAESVNHLEAMSQWASLAKFRAAFHLYVPTGSVDTARRLCADLQIPVDEVWAYNWIGDQMRFTLIARSAAAEAKARSAAARAAGNGSTRAAAPRAAASRPAAPRTASARPAAARRASTTSTATRRKPAAKPRAASASTSRARTSTAKSTARPRAAAKKTKTTRAQKRR